jgi:hypothetical protein
MEDVVTSPNDGMVDKRVGARAIAKCSELSGGEIKHGVEWWSGWALVWQESLGDSQPCQSYYLAWIGGQW